MKFSRAFVIQTAVWISIWLIFALAGGTTNRPPSFYLMVTVRILLLVFFFNFAYYGLLPRYFSGKKRSFFSLTILAFVAYLTLSVGIELYLNPWFKKVGQETVEEHKRPDIPMMFLLIPPFVISLSLFGVAATSRGFAAFENKKKAEEEANRRRLEAEIALLKSQINPHFLLNTLNNLSALSLTEPEKTTDALFRLSELVSYILYECASPSVPLVRDLEFLKGYIALQRLRMPPNVDLQVTLPEEVPETIAIEPMVLIPFIENAFKHGMTTQRPCEILIDLQLNNYQLILMVENEVFPPKQQHSGNPSGVGMVNTHQRLEHTYAGRHQLNVQKDEHRHSVELILDLKP